ncbi:MAG: flavocytochrome c [Limnochordia bacterium]|jgi:fumarate reductase flavoprotein subunit
MNRYFVLSILILSMILAPTVVAQSLTCDVVIVGGGGAGLSAAIEAADNGANVILLEKLAFLGGETLISAGTIQGSYTSVQDEAGIADARKDLFKYWMEAAHYRNDADLVRTVVDMSSENVDWLIDMGINYTPASLGGGGWTPVYRAHRTPGGGSEFIRALAEQARKKNVQILLETRATDLIVENGRVVGVKASGKASEVRANAVILATGGYAANPELIAKYAPKFVNSQAITTPGNTGDGLIMGQSVGAKLVNLGGVIGMRSARGASYRSPLSNLAGRVLVYVNPEGKRFVDENSYYALIGEAIHRQGGVVYQIFDERVRAGLSADYQEEIEKALATGQIKKGSTIADLAVQLGMDPDVLTNTINEFNHNTALGHDPVMWRDPSTLLQIDQAPYYALEVVHAHIGTLGGLAIDTDARVINTEGEVIPGLYAAGSVTGGFFGEVYPAGGSAIAMIVATGRIAGRNAAQE